MCQWGECGMLIRDMWQDLRQSRASTPDDNPETRRSAPGTPAVQRGCSMGREAACQAAPDAGNHPVRVAFIRNHMSE